MKRLIFATLLILVSVDCFAQFDVLTSSECKQKATEQHNKLIEAEKLLSEGIKIVHGYEFYKFKGGKIVVKDTILDGYYHPDITIYYESCYKAYNIEKKQYFDIIQKIMDENGDHKEGKQIIKWKMGYGWKHPTQSGNIGFQYIIEDKIMIIYNIKI